MQWEIGGAEQVQSNTNTLICAFTKHKLHGSYPTDGHNTRMSTWGFSSIKSQHPSNERYPNVRPCRIGLVRSFREELSECLLLVGYSISKERPRCHRVEDRRYGIAEHQLRPQSPVVKPNVRWMPQHAVSVANRKRDFSARARKNASGMDSSCTHIPCVTST